MMEKRIWLHCTLTEGLDVKAYAALKTGHEARDYFGNDGPHVPCGLPNGFSELYVRWGSRDGDNAETWRWGAEEACETTDALDEHALGPGVGLTVVVDGVTLYDDWKPCDDGDD